jgi:hypothetical protein
MEKKLYKETANRIMPTEEENVRNQPGGGDCRRADHNEAGTPQRNVRPPLSHHGIGSDLSCMILRSTTDV